MSATPVGVQQVPDSPAPLPRSRVVVRADLLPALWVFGVVAVLGLPLGWLWSRLAPVEIASVVAAPGAGELGLAPLLGQSEHRFDAMAIFVLFGLAAGVLTGVALWFVRSLRGPVVLVGAVLGSLVAAWLGMRVGLWLAGWRYPLGELKLGEVVARAPVLASAWVIVAQPFGVAVAYSLAVSWHGSEDLGRL
ncbi:MAG TPA: DUF2567 domain-containing protein [Pseudonocardiaceae bacterium]|nr:DUF2567 domain-containing protein [Pseudonocardiaceae bacterium]